MSLEECGNISKDELLIQFNHPSYDAALQFVDIFSFETSGVKAFADGPTYVPLIGFNIRVTDRTKTTIRPLEPVGQLVISLPDYLLFTTRPLT